MSNAFKRDLGAGRMQPSRRRGDSKAERGAGEGGTAGGQLPPRAGASNGATFFPWPFPAAAALFFFSGAVRTQRAGVPAVMRVAQLPLRTQPARFHSFTAQRFPLPRPSEQDPASYQRSSCHAALLRALPADGQSRWQRRIISFFPPEPCDDFLPAVIFALLSKGSCRTRAEGSRAQSRAATGAPPSRGWGERLSQPRGHPERLWCFSSA